MDVNVKAPHAFRNGFNHMLFRTGAIYSKEITKFKYYGNYCTYLREIIERLNLAKIFLMLFKCRY